MVLPRYSSLRTSELEAVVVLREQKRHGKKRATCPAAMSYGILLLAADGVKEKESA